MRYLNKNYWVVANYKINSQNRKILNAFLLNMHLADRAEGTIIVYRRLLERFLLDCPNPIGELTSDNALTWLKNQVNRWKPTTTQNVISILSSFFQFCQKEDHINRVPIKKRWRPRAPKPIPRYLDKSETARVKIHSDKLSLRNRIIVEFLLSSGCRRNELCNLDTTDIDLPNKTATVLGKGGKIRQVHFSETCAILLEKYLTKHPGKGPLFLNQIGDRLSSWSVYKIIKRLGSKAKLTSTLNPHRFRHTFATYLLTKGASLEFISEELGHSNLNTTRVYARLPSEEIVAQYRKYMG